MSLFHDLTSQSTNSPAASRFSAFKTLAWNGFARRGATMRLLALTALLLLAGCFNPANWDKERVAKDMKEAWAKYNITEISLNPVADGFEGTAKSADGETFKISLKKNSDTKSIKGTGVGDRGTELDYSVAAK